MDSQGSIKNTLIAQLFQQNYDWLCKLSYQTGCSHSAEDLAAEAFLQVWMLPTRRRSARRGRSSRPSRNA